MTKSDSFQTADDMLCPCSVSHMSHASSTFPILQTRHQQLLPSLSQIFRHDTVRLGFSTACRIERANRWQAKRKNAHSLFHRPLLRDEQNVLRDTREERHTPMQRLVMSM